MPTDQMAALAMYDFPDVVDAHDAFWHALSLRLRGLGVADPPAHLTRGIDHAVTWRYPRLLFGQACEYPLTLPCAPPLRIVAAPCYGVAGCDRATYRSAIVVRDSDAASHPGDLRGRRCVINGVESNSGMNLLRAVVAELANGQPFFSSVITSGSHADSARLVEAGEADVAAIDCVTYAHLRRAHPPLVASLRVLAWTPAAGTLPYVTACATSDSTVIAMRAALQDCLRDPSLREVFDALFLTGFDLQPDESLTLTRQLAERAQALGYPVLC